AARVVADDRVLDHERSIVIVAHEEDGAAVGVDLIVFDERAAHGQRHGSAVVVDGPPAAAPWCAFFSGVTALADRAIVREQAVDDGPRDPDAADPATVRAGVTETLGPAEGRVDDVRGQALVLAEHANRSAHVRPRVGAHVVEEARVHQLETTAARPDGAATVAFFVQARYVF